MTILWHCQICGRAIKTMKTYIIGSMVIAHHGYQRPHQQHFQTGSCPGARHPAYELSRDQIKYMIEAYQDRVTRYKMSLQTHIDSPPETIEYVRETRYVRNPTPKVFTKPAGWTAPAKHPSTWEQYTYEGNHARVRLNFLRMIKEGTETIEFLQKRWNDWVLKPEGTKVCHI
jgi:hypothetical protein